MHEEKVGGRVIIGSLKGNTQGLGKDIVAATLRATGFQVVDLGIDVQPERFAEAVVQEKAWLIAISISVGETVLSLRDVVNNLKQRKLRDKVRIVVGGQGVSEKTCRNYEVDAYARDAEDCVKIVRRLLELQKTQLHAQV